MSDDKGTEPTTEPKADDAAALKKALDSERAARKAAEKRASDAEGKVSELETANLRRDVAAAKGLSDAQAKRLAGTTKEEMEADADDLLDAFKTEEKPSYLGSRPKEALRPGASNTDSDETPDVGKIADKIIGGPGY